MFPGKLASQAGHAYLDAFLLCQHHDPPRAAEYRSDGHGIKVALRVKGLTRLLDLYETARFYNLPASVITDLGYTVFNGVPTVTALGIGPARWDECDSFLGKLQLL